MINKIECNCYEREDVVFWNKDSQEHDVLSKEDYVRGLDE